MPDLSDLSRRSVGAVVGYGQRPMFNDCCARSRFPPPALLIAVVFVAVAVSTVAVLGAMPAGAVVEPQQSDEGFDANETEGTIERVRYQLLGIAAVTGVLLVGYVWHTDPQRRQRVATRRREDRERAAVAALEEDFVLPAEIADEPPDAVGSAPADE